ncbi:unnamed protein product [Brachionus calyciflorus]|uniref:Uncharacterized protein n=1 Tax=Brachionus calyciflorus TaxID=104777 RepID=A0A813QYL4_9BILA|nr:unnamed protein product [Brachionus calyciflorus]
MTNKLNGFLNIFILVFLLVTFIFLIYDKSYETHRFKIIENEQLKISSKLQKYFDIHEKILNSVDPMKKIVFSEHVRVGFGNRLYNVLTSTLIAILSDSAIQIKWPYIDKYIKTPALYALRFCESTSQLSIDYRDRELNFILPEGTENNWSYDKKLELIGISSINTDHKRLVYNGYMPHFFELSANPIYYNKLLEYGLVRNETIFKANEALSNDNMNELEKIESLYMIGFEVGSNLLNEFWLIKPSFLNEINSFYNDNLKDYFVIGMQFRLEYLNEDDDIGRFVKCAEYIQRLNKVSNRVKWFVTSDSERIFKLLKKFTKGIEIVRGRGKIGHIIEDPHNYYRTIMDNELLSRSNEIIITGGSTYGFVASMKKGKLPYYIEGKREYEANENEECKIMTFNRGPRNHYGDSVL